MRDNPLKRNGVDTKIVICKIWIFSYSIQNGRIRYKFYRDIVFLKKFHNINITLTGACYGLIAVQYNVA